MSYIAVLDYLLFSYWYILANRYDVLNFHEQGFLPGRYIVSGLVAGAILYWVYLIPVGIIRRLNKRYRHPRWWLLWSATAVISSTWVMTIVRSSSVPPLELWVAVGLLVHLQLVHFIMFMVAERVMHRALGSILPGVRSAVIFLGLWLFWIWFSFHVHPNEDPRPVVGSAVERYLLALLIVIFIGAAAAYRLRWELPYLPYNTYVIAPLQITLSDAIDGFYSAWALFYITLPVIHYLWRGYVMTHSSLFPAFLLGFLVPLGWSLLWMWVIVVVSKPELLLRLPRPRVIWQRLAERVR
jgi:hypothetical protein